MSRMNWITLPVFLLITTPLMAADPPAASAPQAAPKTVMDQASYGIGISIGRDLKKQKLAVNPAMLTRGVIDALSGKQALSDEQIRSAMGEFQKLLRAGQAKSAEKNKQLGTAFLAANGKKPGVKTLPSGLQYKVLKSGEGAQPKAADRVRAHYHGTLIDGTVFDSSVQRGKPLEIPVGGVIRGWSEALQLMHVGDKWQLVIPPELAYGPRGAGADIGPDSTLVFEIELLDILK